MTVDWLSLERGESMMTARHFYRYLGGNAANVAVGLARLGLDSVILSRVGSDIHGEYLLQCLKREKVDASWVSIDPGQSTSQCF
ncbi:MAG: carbohydrate kinase family protein, partial [Candidatus Obscuribacterales bacterium]|nr:carbohydrate kinase family protein [Candidatus Obscuribacterales bacterium]